MIIGVGTCALCQEYLLGNKHRPHSYKMYDLLQKVIDINKWEESTLTEENFQVLPQSNANQTDT